jgi:hypothetical protein
VIALSLAAQTWAPSYEAPSAVTRQTGGESLTASAHLVSAFATVVWLATPPPRVVQKWRVGGRDELGPIAVRSTGGFRTIQVYPKDQPVIL